MVVKAAPTPPFDLNNLMEVTVIHESDNKSSWNNTLSVVSPVYGCVGCLEELVERIKRTVYASGLGLEIILVDDGSPDHAWECIVGISRMHPEVCGIRLSRNFGQHHAIAAGIEHASGNLVAVMDCDLQDIPEELADMIAVAVAGNDVVLAQRVERQDTVFKRWGSYLFSRLLSYLTGVSHDHSTANFGIYSRRVIDTVNQMPEADPCFPLMVKWTGFPVALVAVEHAQRVSGKSGYGFRKLFRLALSIILSYSDKPLRLVLRLGLLFSGMAFAIVLISIYRFVAGDIAVAGFTSIIASIWLLGGVTIFCIGITGLYLGRLFNNAKRRPRYVISDVILQQARQS